VSAPLLRAVPDPRLRRVLADVAHRQDPPVPVIGFPKATDIDYGPLAPLAGGTLNNIGDPTVTGLEARNVKDLEQEVVGTLADLFGAATDNRWGCVTTGGTEGNLYGLLLARTLHPAAVVYHSAAAHYSVPKAAHLLSLPTVVVPCQRGGQMDYAALAAAAAGNRERPAVVVATVGTTMTEAVDDVARIATALDAAYVPVARRYVHADAALTGIPLALTGPVLPPSCNLTRVNSLSISGHKFLGTPEPCGVVLTRRTHRDTVARSVSYIGGVDATIAGSRSGHTVLQLWWALTSMTLEDHWARAVDARGVAEHAVRALGAIGVPAWRHPHAFTVVFPTPSAAMVTRWSLATADGISHVVCVPGVSAATIDRFVAELATDRAADRR
jgi:histidine decarboxylase